MASQACLRASLRLMLVSDALRMVLGSMVLSFHGLHCWGNLSRQCSHSWEAEQKYAKLLISALVWTAAGASGHMDRELKRELADNLKASYPTVCLLLVLATWYQALHPASTHIVHAITGCCALIHHMTAHSAVTLSEQDQIFLCWQLLLMDCRCIIKHPAHVAREGLTRQRHMLCFMRGCAAQGPPDADGGLPDAESAREAQLLESWKAYKKGFHEGVALFNEKPKKGIAFMQV